MENEIKKLLLLLKKNSLLLKQNEQLIKRCLTVLNTLEFESKRKELTFQS